VNARPRLSDRLISMFGHVRALAGPSLERITADLRRSTRGGGRLLRDQRLKVGFGYLVAATETFTFLPIALLLVLMLHELYGPTPTLAAIVMSRLLFRRPSIQAMAWMSGGVYLAVLLVDAGSSFARQQVDQLAAPTHDLLALACTAGGTATFVLTFVLPAGRTAARHFPRFSSIVTIWAVELTKGALAGATIGAGLISILPVAGPLSSDSEVGRALTIALASTIGLVVGGLRADARVWSSRGSGSTRVGL
jgi:hypothetical protein